MPAIFDHHRTVVAAEIDGQGHANNVAFVQWMQDAALAHSGAQGWSPEAYRELGVSWVARSHFIEYRRPAFEREEILVRTWVASMERCSSVRRYQVLRAADLQLLAVAETNWAFVSLVEQKLVRIPPEIAASFSLVERGLKATDPVSDGSPPA